jgi:2OG-Fe(II) oxygenase superfamily
LLNTLFSHHRHINLANATPEKLEQLAQVCEPASFGLKKECVLDETYRKAGKMDSEWFSSTLDLSHTDLMKIIRGYLLEGTQSTNNVKTELYKLNVYSTHLFHIYFYLILRYRPGKGSFFRPHVDTPRSDKMFGSLVIVFPSPHEGGALLLRHRNQEWTFDSGEALAATEDQPSIGYVAFFSDIEHEVTPVTSGHRITLTYNLYFDDGGPVSPNDAVSERFISPRLPNQDCFRDAFAALLENPEFLADGGTLAFGLRHVYPIKNDLKHVYKILKGSDAVVYQSVLALGYEPVLYMYYDNRGVMIDKVVNFSHWLDSFCSDEGPQIGDVVQMEGGILVHPEGAPIVDDPYLEVDIPEGVEWVTPVTEFNRQTEAVVIGYAGNEPAMDFAYGDVCLVVRVGKAGDRLAYRTAAQLKRAYLNSDRLAELMNRFEY